MIIIPVKAIWIASTIPINQGKFKPLIKKILKTCAKNHP